MTSEVLVRWSQNVDSSDSQVAEVLSEVEAVLRSEPLLGNPLSICDLIDALPGNGEASTRMSMLELLPQQLKRAFCISEQNRAVVRFRLQDIGIASYGPVFERVQTQLGKIEAETR